MSSLNFGENKRRSPRGGCGLKFLGVDTLTQSGMSLSSRRAWIEILFMGALDVQHVRRSPRGGRGLKYTLLIHRPCRYGRSPRGGRGLKSFFVGALDCIYVVALLAEGVD